MELFDVLGMFVAVVWWGGEGGWTSLGGADALFGLCEVALYGLLTSGAIPGGIDIGETRTGGEVAGFDSGYPGGFNWESSGGVEVADEGPNAGEVVGIEGSWGCWSRGMDR